MLNRFFIFEIIGDFFYYLFMEKTKNIILY
ncbi:hypothetical protein M2408_005181 [Sphingobacterium sp. BIGb0165]|nr:hypothetical protein [Sphingobacterium sp. BIGb0165]